MGSDLRANLMLTYQFDEYVNDRIGNRRKDPPMVVLSNQGDGSYAPVIEMAPQRMGPGMLLTADRSTVQFDTGAGDTDINPLLSLRLKSGTLGDGWYIVPEFLNLWINANIACRVGLYLDPTVSGSDLASWTEVANSHGYEGSSARVEYDRTRTNSNPITAAPGTMIWTQYGYAVNQVLNFDLRGLAYPLAQGEELVVGAQNVIAANNSYLAGLTFRLMYRS